MSVILANTLPATDVIYPYMSVFFVAFAVAIIGTPLMRMVALRKGVVDWPDLQRKSHIEPVAYLGGVAIFLAWIAGIAVCYWGPFFDSESPIAQTGLVASVKLPISIAVGAIVITGFGLIDDVSSIPPRMKVAGQFFAAAMLAANDVGTNLVGRSFELLNIPVSEPVIYALGTVVIAVFVIGGCNSVNLLDGLDGLASGVVAIACLGFLFIAVTVVVGALALSPEAAGVSDRLVSGTIVVVMCLALLGAVLGFLPYNFNPANIFMGDAGSQLLGYLCVTTILLFAEVGIMGPRLVIAALIVFALPITDTALAIFRRALRSQPLMSPDNQHLHHQLLGAARRNLKLGNNLSVKFAVLVMYGLATVFAVLGCALVSERRPLVVAFFVVIFGFVMVSAYKTGHQRHVIDRLKKTGHVDVTTEPPSLPATPPAKDNPAAAESGKDSERSDVHTRPTTERY